MTREMRHIGIRVIISTQGEIGERYHPHISLSNLSSEPTTVPGVLLDLCGIAILHRFSSPAWLEHVLKHFSAKFGAGALDQIVNLQVSL